jgi:tetratricopeptide (TPR) repeat protein
VLKAQPGNIYALSTKGAILLYEKNATGALALFNRILTTHPDLTAALDNKGIALEELGNHTGALSILNTALKLDPRDEYAFYIKALVLIELGLHTHNLGDLGVALENLDMALDINPNLDDKDALHMKTLLTQLLRQYGYMKQ